MNPSPDRGKECLPPKKRDPRQGSVEHHVTLDEFKPPVPLRIRPGAGRGEGGREASDRDRALTNPSPHLLHAPPALPAPAPALQIPLPWNLSYSSPVSLYPGHVSERRVPASPAWKDDLLSSPLSHHRWPLSLSPSPSSPASSFKAPYPADSREMWSYINSSRRDYSSALLPSYLFSPSLYPHDAAAFDARHRSPGKRPNGLDGAGSRTASTSRPLLTGEYMNDSHRSRPDASPHGSHANGGRRQPEDTTSRVHAGGSFLESQAQEGPELHSSLQDRHPPMVKSPHPLGPDPRAGRGGVLDPLGATPVEAQICYSLGSVCHPSPLAQSYPLYSPSGSPLYSLHREPGPRQHSLRNSPHSPLGLPNNHDRSQRDRDRESLLHRDREGTKEQERDGEHERRRDRDRGTDSSPSHPHTSPPALLPHFTKGSLIELASGRLKRVEELRTEDFLRSADTSPEFHLSTCTVLQISSGSAQGFSHLQVHLTDRSTQVSLTPTSLSVQSSLSGRVVFTCAVLWFAGVAEGLGGVSVLCAGPGLVLLLSPEDHTALRPALPPAHGGGYLPGSHPDPHPQPPGTRAAGLQGPSHAAPLQGCRRVQ